MSTPNNKYWQERFDEKFLNKSALFWLGQDYLHKDISAESIKAFIASEREVAQEEGYIRATEDFHRNKSNLCIKEIEIGKREAVIEILKLKTYDEDVSPMFVTEDAIKEYARANGIDLTTNEVEK